MLMLSDRNSVLQSKKGKSFSYELFDLAGRKIAQNQDFMTTHCLCQNRSGSIYLCKVLFENGDTEVLKLVL